MNRFLLAAIVIVSYSTILLCLGFPLQSALNAWAK